MGHDFVDQMLERTQAGELRSPVSETLGMQLVKFGRGEAVYEMAASEDLGNPLGVIQGVVATALADGSLVIDAVITAMLRETMPDAEVRVYDMTGPMDHLDVFVRTKAFEDIYRVPPSWYVCGPGQFSAMTFSNSISGMSSAAASSMSSSPSSSGSGGGGSSGGGSGGGG